jgi:putative transposase
LETYWQRRPKQHRALQQRRSAPRALTEPERQGVFEMLHSERFGNRAPTEVYATLLDEGIHLASPRTMYRILAGNCDVRERKIGLPTVAELPAAIS